MGMVHAVQKGELSPSKVSSKVRKVAGSIDKEDAEDYASTKHKGKPEKVKQETKVRALIRKMVSELMDEGFAGGLKKEDRKAFDKMRRKQSEVLGYTLTGTDDVKTEIGDATIEEGKLTEVDFGKVKLPSTVGRFLNKFVDSMKDAKLNRIKRSAILYKVIDAAGMSPQTLMQDIQKIKKELGEGKLTEGKYFQKWQENLKNLEKLYIDVHHAKKAIPHKKKELYKIEKHYKELHKLIPVIIGQMVDEGKLTETKFYAFFNRKKHTINGKSLYDAKQKAIIKLKVPKSKVGMLSIVNAKEHERGSFRFEGKLKEAVNSKSVEAYVKKKGLKDMDLPFWKVGIDYPFYPTKYHEVRAATAKDAEKQISRMYSRSSGGKVGKAVFDDSHFLKVNKNLKEGKLIEGKFGKFDTGMNFKGNGMTIYDRNQSKGGDFRDIAHISEKGKLTIYDKDVKKDPHLMKSLKAIAKSTAGIKEGFADDFMKTVDKHQDKLAQNALHLVRQQIMKKYKVGKKSPVSKEIVTRKLVATHINNGLKEIRNKAKSPGLKKALQKIIDIREKHLKKMKEGKLKESGILYKAGVKKYGKEGMKKIQQAAGKRKSHAAIGAIKDKYEKGKKDEGKLNEAKETIFDVAERVMKDKQMYVYKSSRGKVKVDMQTANLLTKVWKKINSKMKKYLSDLGDKNPAQLVQTLWAVVK
jgi:hypothetical protein